MMKLPTLKGLSKQYKKHYRFHLNGEPAFLRGLNPKDQTDFIRYKKIFQDPKVEEYIEGANKDSEVPVTPDLGVVARRGGVFISSQ